MEVEYKYSHCGSFGAICRSLSLLVVEIWHFLAFLQIAETFNHKMALGPRFFSSNKRKNGIPRLVRSKRLQKNLGSMTFQTFLQNGPAYYAIGCCWVFMTDTWVDYELLPPGIYFRTNFQHLPFLGCFVVITKYTICTLNQWFHM